MSPAPTRILAPLLVLALAPGCLQHEEAPPAAPTAAQASPPARAPTTDFTGELLPNPSLADGARGWTLERARAAADLGPDEGPAVLLPSPVAGEWPAALSVTVDVPAGSKLRIAVAGQGLAEGQRLRIACTPRGADGTPVGPRWDQQFDLTSGQWRRYVARYETPASASRLELYIDNSGERDVLLARASLMVENYRLASMNEADITRLTKLVAPDVERLRGRLFKRDVPVTIVDDRAARAFFEVRVEKFWPKERQEADEIACRQLGMWPSDQPLVDAIFELLEEQVGGFYDPDTDAFYVVGDMPVGFASVIIAHELTHALDDQHFGLDERIASLIDDSDRAAAFAAVVEGSGTAIMSAYIGEMMAHDNLTFSMLAEVQASEAGKAEKLSSVPPYLSRSLIFSYVMGQHFLLRGKGAAAAGSVDAADVDRAFRESPGSTEQVLHPEDYWSEPDPPRSVELPDLSATLGPGWTLRRHDSLGELMLPILTGSTDFDPTSMSVGSPAAWTGMATSGWGGDRWQLYEAPAAAAAGSDGAGAGGSAGGAKRHVTLLTTVWDTPGDAQEFEDALRLPPGSHVARRGAAVVIVAGADDATGVEAGALAGAALDAVTPH